MNTIAFKLRKTEFELRIFISLSITGILCFLSFVVFCKSDNNIILIGSLLKLSEKTSLKLGYLLIALLMTIATILRMWAGSHLSSDRIMAFKVQHDVLTTTGPFSLVRNPVYLADMAAYFGFALCLKPVGLILPLLILIHYSQLIRYEEDSLEKQFGDKFQQYKNATPGLLPTIGSFLRNTGEFRKFSINYDGFRHNAQYLLFIPGFIIAAFTGSFLYVVMIGLPAVIDWAVVHTIKGVAENPATTRTLGKKIAGSKVFDDILYAQCWEDPQIDIEAFQTLPEDTIFSITSGGCNVLAFLIDNPKKVIALDLNPCQNYLLDLKMAAFKILEYKQLLEFLGVHRSSERLFLYSLVRTCMKEESRDYWDNNSDKIREGIIHCGRFEGYMHLLKKWFSRVMGKELTIKLMEAGTPEERKKLYDEKWNNSKWKLFTGVFLSRPFMTLLFDKAFFRQLEETFSFGKHFKAIIEVAVTKFSLRENHFLGYILLGNYPENTLPLYLRRENFETIRNRLNRIEMVNGDCQSYFSTLPDNMISKFNFTNIFEWMPRNTFEAILRETVRVAMDQSVMTYRNLLVPRSRPDKFSDTIVAHEIMASKLHVKDQSFMYRKYVVEQITKKNGISG